MQLGRILAAWIVTITALSSASVYAKAPHCVSEKEVSLLDLNPTEQFAMKLFIHLTGAPVSIYDGRFKRVVQLLGAHQDLAAAQLIEDAPNFLSVRVRNFSIGFIDKDHRPSDTLTDLQALIIGVVRDEIDARQLLTGDLRYSGYDMAGLPPVSRGDNDHYAQFEARNLDFNRDLERVDKQWEDLDYVAGALSTRAWAAAYYNAGTNRMGVTYAIDAFLCTPKEEWKLRGLPDFYVRRDVNRAPGGDPAEYQNKCRNCHSAMDAMGGAFAKYDFVDAKFTYQAVGVVPKMNKNGDMYPAGYVTSDDSWLNMLSHHPTIDFGWRGPLEGMGVHSFADGLAQSKAFSRCFVQKVFSEVCGKNIKVEAPALLQPMADDFESNAYNLKYLFAKVAVDPTCLDRGQMGEK
jgi:hypothetical protein